MKRDAQETRAGFGEGLLAAGRRNKKVVSVDADLRGSCKTAAFAKAFPRRAFQVGIAEQNAVGFAAGLATTGFTPFFASFAVFATGLGYNQIRQSVCYSHKNVKIVGSHAGLLTGEDGATHQALEDISLMRGLPGMRVFCPADFWEAKAMTEQLAESEGPAYLRLGRGKTPTLFSEKTRFSLSGLRTLKKEKRARAALFATGWESAFALEAAELLSKKGLAVSVFHAPVLSPFPAAAAARLAAEHSLVFSIEDHSIIGGLGSALAESIAERGLKTRLVRLGARSFGESGSGEALLKKHGLDAAGIAKRVERELRR